MSNKICRDFVEYPKRVELRTNVFEIASTNWTKSIFVGFERYVEFVVLDSVMGRRCRIMSLVIPRFYIPCPSWTCLKPLKALRAIFQFQVLMLFSITFGGACTSICSFESKVVLDSLIGSGSVHFLFRGAKMCRSYQWETCFIIRMHFVHICNRYILDVKSHCGLFLICFNAIVFPPHTIWTQVTSRSYRGINTQNTVFAVIL